MLPIDFTDDKNFFASLNQTLKLIALVATCKRCREVPVVLDSRGDVTPTTTAKGSRPSGQVATIFFNSSIADMTARMVSRLMALRRNHSFHYGAVRRLFGGVLDSDVDGRGRSSVGRARRSQ